MRNSKVKKAVEIEPLTKTSGVGALTRRPEVEAQISAMLQFDADYLLSRLAVSDYDDPDFVKNETVVFLIRYYRNDGDDELVNSLVTLLIARLTRPIERRIRFVAENLIDDCRGDVIFNVFRPILDLSSDEADYAQVSFGPWFVNRIIDIVRKYFTVQGRDAKTDSLTAEDGEDELELPDTGSSFRRESAKNLEQWDVIEKAVRDLTHNEKTAFLMRHFWGFEVENKNSAIPTISKHLGVTPRTIRNWLNSAEAKIARWREQQGAQK